jgi:ABC-2 type transport system permease protein
MGFSNRFAIWCVVLYFALLEAMLAAAILFWPSFRENVGAIRALLPLAALREAFDSMNLGDKGVGGYVLGQQFFKGCNTLGTAAGVFFAVGAVAGEVHRRTLEICLARPISRRRILTERYAAGALALVLPVFASTATIPWLLGMVGETMAQRPLFLCAVHQSATLLLTFSLTFLCSALGRNPMAIALGMLFLTTFQFSLYLVKTLSSYSYFRLTDIRRFLRIFERGELDLTLLAVLTGASLICFVGAQIAFARRVP